ncbi:hypothetical protein GN244_ATG16000 [Phytophthora infestans]|uniref:Uncharacterized protein n=1 Tax=Phytophthora infestans TaxID=4787 RepID=A0A833W6W8_PHYIN|nr:hypothetical protein GN244_ATG16000 [Phytophthora infestans]
MTDAVLVQWTQQGRLEVLVHCLNHVANTAPDLARKEWSQQWMAAFKNQVTVDPTAVNLYPDALWKVLKQQKYENMELLKYCRASQKERLTRMLLAAQIYHKELRSISSRSSSGEKDIMLYLETLFEGMEKNSSIAEAVEQSETSGYWTTLETLFATKALYEDQCDNSSH